MPTEKKRATVAQLIANLSRSNLLVLAEYIGLNMKDMTTVRRALQRVGGGFHVVKNTLLLRALGESEVSGLEPYLEGPIAVLFAYEDVIAAARVLKEQASSFPALKIRAGWMEGRALPAEVVQELATVPPRPILLGQVAGTVQAPVAGVVNGLAAVLRQLIYVLQSRAEQGAEAA
jgi:large subunit ribosomal protein L10